MLPSQKKTNPGKLALLALRPGQTRMRVEKREFAKEFRQLSDQCFGQTRMRVDENKPVELASKQILLMD